MTRPLTRLPRLLITQSRLPLPLLTRRPPTPLALPRAFSLSHSCLKKQKSKHAADAAEAVPEPVSDKTAAYDEAFDFQPLERSVLKAIESLTHKLAELRTGGSLSPKVVESLTVQLDKKADETSKIADIGHVVTKGRHLHVILSDESHVKAVKSAIQGANLNMTPQGPTEREPTTLVLAVPPQTGESREKAQKEAQRLAGEALEKIREARHKKDKKLKKMKQEKTVRPDDVQKALKEMESVTKRGQDEVKKILDGWLKVLAG